MALLRVPSIEQLAIPGVSILILFLAYTSQYLFYYIDPGPLTKRQALWFNGFVLGIWWCYDRACTVDPGPRGWIRKVGLDGDDDDGEDVILGRGKRWCRKCEAVKPPRAHHCKKCGRYAFQLFSTALYNTLLISADVSQRWTIIALGPRTASPSRHSHISSVSSSML
jgi:hypothetical protein